MTTRIDEIAPDIYRCSTFIGEAGICFNQYLLVDEDPLLFHTGPRALFEVIHDAVATVIEPERLRWVTFGHFESDECGSMNQWLDVAPKSEVAAGMLANLVSLNDMADRAPYALGDGDVLELGSMRVRHIDTPHVPHGWDARVLFEETTGTLLCGDLFTTLGDTPPTTTDDIVGPATAAEDAFRFSCLAPNTPTTVRRLAELVPARLALMHGPVYEGDGAAALGALADDYEQRIEAARLD